MQAHRVVIIGGGFGGLYCAKSLRKAPLQVTLIDRRNLHLFQPLLYQVATDGLSPANIAAPLRAVLERQKNTEVLLAEAIGFDLVSHRVPIMFQWAWNYITWNRSARLITGDREPSRAIL